MYYLENEMNELGCAACGGDCPSCDEPEAKEAEVVETIISKENDDVEVDLTTTPEFLVRQSPRITDYTGHSKRSEEVTTIRTMAPQQQIKPQVKLIRPAEPISDSTGALIATGGLVLMCFIAAAVRAEDRPVTKLQ